MTFASSVRRSVNGISLGSNRRLSKFLGHWRLRVGLPVVVFTVQMLAATAAFGQPDIAYCAIPAVFEARILADYEIQDKCDQTINITAALGEFESGSFAIRTTMEVPDLRVLPEGLSNGSFRLDSSIVQLSYVKAWYQAGTALWSIRQDKSKRVLVPELLLNDDDLVRVDIARQKNYLRVGDTYVDISDDRERKEQAVTPVPDFPVRDANSLNPLRIPPNTTRQIWVTLEVGVEVKPGRYLGRILLVSTSRQISIAVPIVLTVLPFVLQKPVLEYGIYYRGQLDAMGLGSISSEMKSEKQLAAELRDMARHGVSNPTVFQEPSEEKPFARVLHERAKAGLDNRTINYLGITTGNFDDLGRMEKKYVQLQRLLRIAQSVGVRNFNVGGIDEAEAPDIQRQYSTWNRVRDIGAGIFTAAWRDGPAERQYAGRLKLLVLGIEPDETVNAFYRKAGTAVYLYNYPQVGVENPLLYRINYGLRAWRAGFDGVMNYAYQHSFGFIWNDFDHPDFRDHVFAYPTADGVVDTLAWEGFREGVDDVRYVSTLQKLFDLTGSAEASAAISSVRDMRGIDPDRSRAYMAAEIVNICHQLQADRRATGVCKN